MKKRKNKNPYSKAQEDELEVLFKTFDKTFHDFEQKFSDIEKNIEMFRKEKNLEDV